MELSDFISKTLIDIKTGLRNANEHFALQEGKKLGLDAEAAFILPAYAHGGKDGCINFDIAVTVSKESSESGGAGIKIAVVNIGGEIKGIDRQESISHIKFSLASSLTTG